MRRLLRARWLLPIDKPPIENGWIDCVDGRIAALGTGSPPVGTEELGDAAILPGLVNAHTHLELSWMAGRVPPAESFGEWLRQIIRERTVGPAGGEAAAIAAAEDAIVEARRTGTVLVGDISNTLMTPALLAANRMAAVVFHELLGFNASDADGIVREAWRRVDDVASQLTDSPHVGMGVVAHAPYSVSPALF